MKYFNVLILQLVFNQQEWLPQHGKTAGTDPVFLQFEKLLNFGIG